VNGDVDGAQEAGRRVAERLGEAVGDAFAAATRDRAGQRSAVGHELSLSGLGGCTRRAAYASAGVEPTEDVDGDEGRQATMGAWVHDGLLPHLSAQLPGSVIEQPVTLHANGRDIPGRYDLYWPDGAAMVDLKTARLAMMNVVRRRGRRDSHLLQVGGYGLGKRQEGARVEWLGWLYVDRDSGDEEIRVAPFTDTVALEVIERVVEIDGWARPENLPYAPREERGPGLSRACDWCPWLRACWGSSAEPGTVGAQRVHENAAVAAALAAYRDALDKIRPLEMIKEFARAQLDGAPPGVYGDLELRWSQSSEELDKAEARRLLEEAGLPVPVKGRKGSVSVGPPRKKREPRRRRTAGG
jgi:hypothetical protein